MEQRLSSDREYAITFYKKYQPKAYLLHDHPLNMDLSPPAHINVIRDMKLHPDDVFVVGYQKSGTIWLQTTVMAIQNSDNMDQFEAEGPIGNRTVCEIQPAFSEIDSLPRPTVFSSHLPFTLLPKAVTEGKNKVIYITRNPKDIAVSLFYMLKMVKGLPSELRNLPWEMHFHMFLSDVIFPTLPLWIRNVTEWLKYSDQSHIKFIHYEDFVADPDKMVMQLAEFLNKTLSADQIKRIAEMVSVKSMQDNPKLDIQYSDVIDGKGGRFIRKGKVGDWKNHFTEEQNKMFDKIYQKFVAETGLTQAFE